MSGAVVLKSVMAPLVNFKFSNHPFVNSVSCRWALAHADININSNKKTFLRVSWHVFLLLKLVYESLQRDS
ncbi:hypothetical protein LWM68_01225 [Niabella sp. W65]|nr:hypothetical protein [Niabella sp. W65]MCH7361525.1 hypothetical protein [Niabella sp. W65]